jgi:DNA-directed RNA polymerase specialized sigma24 family protein
MALEREGIDFEAHADTFDVESIMSVVKYLRADDRVLLEHVYWERLTYREIAVVLGISVNAVGIGIDRAKRNLRSLLDQNAEWDRPLEIFDRKTEG